jgi:8-oxo-dGDP phosphatase
MVRDETYSRSAICRLVMPAATKRTTSISASVRLSQPAVGRRRDCRKVAIGAPSGQVDVELPGGERFWHHVVRLHRAAMMVLVDDSSRVLLLWRHRFLPDRWGWEIPGGLVDGDEEPADAAARELKEETGYRAGRVEQLITFQPIVGSVDSEHVVFVGRDPQRIGDPADASEVTRMEWVPRGSVPELITAGKIWNAGSLVALMRLLMNDSS